MLSEYLELPVSLVLGISLGIFISQRKLMDKCLGKRKAVLIISAMIAVFWFSIVYVNKALFLETSYNPDLFLVVPGLIFFTALVIFRKYIFVFKTRCRICSNRIDYKNYLYSDKNVCADCELKGKITIDDINWDTWDPEEKAVLCIIRRKDEVLLINKKTGLGAGLVNFPGGRIEKGESPEQASIRETEEEVGLKIDKLKEAGLLSFVFMDGYSLSAHLYITETFEGQEIETDEADPFWCKIDKIPFDKMWEDDILWIPELLKGKYIKAFFVFDGDKMTDQKVISE